MSSTSEIHFNSPSIKALGNLFTLTEVSLWDDGFSSDYQQPTLPKHTRFKYDDDDDDDDGKNSSKTSSINTVDVVIVGDVGVTNEMCALGLPLSFQTNKQKRGGQHKGKIGAAQLKNQNSNKTSDECVEEATTVNGGSSSLDQIQDQLSKYSVSFAEKSEPSFCSSYVAGGPVGSTHPPERHNLEDMSVDLTCNSLEDHVHDSASHDLSSEPNSDDLVEVDTRMETEMTLVDNQSNLYAAVVKTLDDLLANQPEETEIIIMGSSIMQPENFGFIVPVDPPQDTDLSEDSENTMAHDKDYRDSVGCCGICGDWGAYWDPVCLSYYFYNSQTKESTWYPPPGMECFAMSDCCFMDSESNVGMPGTDNGLSTDRSEDVQSGTKELVDEALKVEVAKTRVVGEVSAAELSSASVTVCTAESRMLVDERHNQFKLRPSLNSVEYSHTLENGVKGEDFGDICNGHLKSEEFVATGSPCENADRNCDGNTTAQLSNANSSICAVEVMGDDDSIVTMQLEEGAIKANDLHLLHTTTCKKQKRRRNRRRTKSLNICEVDEYSRAEESCIDISKYWSQRYLLFSKFDDGIEMDEEGWFSVTPEAIAKHQASRFGGDTIIDCFTGVGGNAIQFAKTGKHVIAIDIDPKKIDYARHNASIYGVEDRIDFMVGDSLSLVSKLKADAVFLSPPWGGPDYVKVKLYDINMLQPYNGQLLFNTFKEIASTIIMFLPRNVDIEQLAELSLLADPPWVLEVEKNLLNGKFKAVTAYFIRDSCGAE